MRQRALDRTRPPEQTVPHRMHVLAHDAQSGQLPQQVRHLLHDACAAVLDRQNRGVDGAHLERFERQPKSRIAGSLRVGKDRRDRLVRVGAGLSLIRNFHPKIMCRIASATWLWSCSWSVTGGCPLPSWPLVPFVSAIAAILRRSSSVTSFLVSASTRNRCHASSSLPSARVMPKRLSR